MGNDVQGSGAPPPDFLIANISRKDEDKGHDGLQDCTAVEMCLGDDGNSRAYRPGPSCTVDQREHGRRPGFEAYKPFRRDATPWSMKFDAHYHSDPSSDDTLVTSKQLNIEDTALPSQHQIRENYCHDLLEYLRNQRRKPQARSHARRGRDSEELAFEEIFMESEKENDSVLAA